MRAAVRRFGRAFAKSRLVHFAVFGAALHFAMPREQPSRVVDVDPAALDEVHRAEAARIGVPALDPATTRTVDARVIEDELLYREALRLGLDDGDPIVRQRLVQKLLSLIEDLGGAGREPTEAELRAFFAADPSRWHEPPRLRFVHVFATSEDRLPDAARFAADHGEPPSLGDAFPYPRLVDSLAPEIARLYGDEFSRAVGALAPGVDSGPIHSRLGWHRVRLLSREEGRPATLDEVRGEVALEWTLERREDVVGAWMKKTASEYDVRVGGKKLEHFEPTRRVAARNAGSAED